MKSEYDDLTPVDAIMRVVLELREITKRLDELCGTAVSIKEGIERLEPSDVD